MMQRILRIRRWEDHFETSETRKWKHLKWVPVSNNQNDPGYARLMRRDDGPMLFGVWIAMLQSASRCKTRGVFVEGDGTPYDAESIAAVCQMPIDLISKAIEVFTTEIKWLEWVTPKPSAVAEDSPAIDSLNGTEQNGIESNRTELNRTLDHVGVSYSEPTRDFTEAQGAHDARKLTAITQPRTALDRHLIAKACVLIQCGPVSSRAVWDAAEAVRNSTKPIKKPIAYFFEVLAENATKENHNLREVLRGIPPPPTLIAACLIQPDERLCVDSET